MSDQLATLAALTDARFQADMARLRATTRAEADLRGELDQLNQQEQAFAARETGAEMLILRTVGADLLWRGWVARKRAALNQALARVLVQKAQETEALRHTFGRNHVATELREAAALSNKRDRAARALAQGQEQALMQAQRR